MLFASLTLLCLSGELIVSRDAGFLRMFLPSEGGDILHITQKLTPVTLSGEIDTVGGVEEMLINRRKKAHARLIFPGESNKNFLDTTHQAAEGPAAFLSRSLQNAMYIATRCVALGSHESYSVGYRRWLLFCKCGGLDPTLKLVSTQQSALAATAPGGDVKLAALVAFLGFLVDDLGLDPSSASNYLSGVRHHFRITFLNIEVFSDPVITQVKHGYELDWRASHGLSSEKKRLPFLISMVDVMYKHVLNPKDYKDSCAGLAVKLGFVQLNRASELVPAKNGLNEHYIRAKDVVFHHRHPETGQLYTFLPNEARDFLIENVSAVTINLRSHKADQSGEGNKCHWEVCPVDKNCLFCIASDCFRWAQLAYPAGEQPFFSYQNIWNLSYDKYNEIIKATAFMCGFDPSRFGTHSVRIGGATALAANNHSNHYIMRAGRWKSLAFLDYIFWAKNEMKRALDTLVNPAIFTIKDLLELHPSAVNR